MNTEMKTKPDGDIAKDLLDLARISEIARRALKNLVSRNTPAIPPYYERAFYDVATERGEIDLINHLLSNLPTGQAATLMVSEVSSVINNLNSDIRQYREGLENHDGQMQSTHQQIEELVEPEIWDLLQKDFLQLRNANTKMKKDLAAAEDKLKRQEEQVSQLKRKIRNDPLTGVMNRQAMEEDLTSEFSRSKRYKRVFGIVMADIDHFKSINDSYGHQVGDEALKAFAKILQKSVRDVDTIYRFGGEEFLVLLPESDETASLLVANRLKNMVESQVLTSKKDENLHLFLTASFGVSVYSPTDSTYQDIVKRADQALYRAKENGRNRVEINMGS